MGRCGRFWALSFSGPWSTFQKERKWALFPCSVLPNTNQVVAHSALSSSYLPQETTLSCEAMPDMAFNPKDSSPFALGIYYMWKVRRRSCFKDGESETCSHGRTDCLLIVGHQLKQDGLLQNHLKKIALADIPLPGLLGLFQITRLNIVDVELTAHKLNYVPGLRGAEVVSGVRLSICGSVLAGISSVIKISVEFQSSVKFEIADYQAGSLRVIFRECNILFGDITIQILSLNLTPTALTTIKNSIIANINLQFCNILAVVFDVVRDRLLDTMNVVIPFEPFGSLRCQLASLPDIGNSLLWLNLFTDFDIEGQGLLSIPDSAPDIILPPLEKYRHCQCVHAAVLNIFLSVVLRIQPQEYSCTPNVFSGADELRAAILALIPDPPPFISSAILYFRISLLQSPVIQFGNGFAIVEVSAQIEFFVKNSDGSTTSIVILQESLSLSATFSVTNGYLYASLSISGHKAELISSALGITDISSLEPHCGKLLGETFLVSLNAFLSVGIRLPSILTVILDKVLIQFIEHSLLLCI